MTRSPVKLGPLLERYLEVKFRNHGFPWNPFAANYTATFLDCVLPYSQCTFSHSTRIFDFIQRNSVLLQPERYHLALLDLG